MSGAASQIIILLVGGGGLIGAVVALAKLRPDANTAAVTQAQGAVETMAQINDQLEKDRDGWRQRALEAEARDVARDREMRKLRSEIERLKARHPR